ncbi:hypothetical protein JKP88DRAFT_283911 [Tribonema minus]|uniref:Uncharacterized protein n=1 Tax=Tribonema minus TaxID=303371 RepID=A0A835YRC3_9STRA|nr:hypothetical protein JKP88DRAFT_283911 [Tribonema minus]
MAASQREREQRMIAEQREQEQHLLAAQLQPLREERLIAHFARTLGRNSELDSGHGSDDGSSIGRGSSRSTRRTQHTRQCHHDNDERGGAGCSNGGSGGNRGGGRDGGCGSGDGGRDGGDGGGSGDRHGGDYSGDSSSKSLFQGHREAPQFWPPQLWRPAWQLQEADADARRPTPTLRFLVRLFDDWGIVGPLTATVHPMLVTKKLAQAPKLWGAKGVGANRQRQDIALWRVTEGEAASVITALRRDNAWPGDFAEAEFVEFQQQPNETIGNYMARNKGRKLPDLVECVAITLLERGLAGFFKQQSLRYRLSNVPRFDLEEMRTVLESVERAIELREREKRAAAAAVIPTRCKKKAQHLWLECPQPYNDQNWRDAVRQWPELRQLAPRREDYFNNRRCSVRLRPLERDAADAACAYALWRAALRTRLSL